MLRRVHFLCAKNKTPRVKAFGVLFLGLLHVGWFDNAHAECAPAATETTQLERVSDGDTIKLTDGRYVRVLGVNTPEIDHGGTRTGQPLGTEARAAAQEFFAHNTAIKLSLDREKTDHYGRTLAHVYDAKGNSLAAHLLRLGLGFHIAIPPNLGSVDCLRTAERAAKQQQLGVWGNRYWQPIPAAKLTLADTGFKRVRGRVASVYKAKSGALWLELDGALVINIAPADVAYFAEQDWPRWQGKHVEVRGWIVPHRTAPDTRKRKTTRVFKPLMVQARTSDGLELL
jgi:micrococcal nuclease